MRFRITGADRETGEEVELVVEASDEATAVIKANMRGLMVAQCSPAIPLGTKSSIATPSTSIETEVPRNGWSGTKKVLAITAIVLVVVAAVIAIPFYQSFNAVKDSQDEAAKAAVGQQKIDDAMAKAEDQRQQQIVDRLGSSESPPAAAAPTQTTAEQVDDDPVLRSICDRFPDLEPMLKRLDSSDKNIISLKITLLISSGDMSLTESRHVRDFISQH